jgi:hypothetical protein
MRGVSFFLGFGGGVFAERALILLQIHIQRIGDILSCHQINIVDLIFCTRSTMIHVCPVYFDIIVNLLSSRPPAQRDIDRSQLPKVRKNQMNHSTLEEAYLPSG